MLARRIIPCLDVKDGRVVKGVRFQDTRDAGDPVALAERYDAEGADELVFYDISASHEGRRTMLEVVSRAAERAFIPLTVGGGVSDVEGMRALLRAGADKVSVNTAAVSDPALIDRGAELFGSQCIVLSIDARRVADGGSAARWEVVTHGGRRSTGRDALAWAVEGERRGAGELVLNSIDADGTRDGYDLALCGAVADAVRVPIVASGGAGRMSHMYDVLTAGRADAALAASIFHYGDVSIPELKRYLAAQAVPVRPGGSDAEAGQGGGAVGSRPAPGGAWIEGLRFGPDGLLPVIVQDAGTAEVLMLAYADREALRRTADERRAWFWSRSRRELWRKGDTSGNALDVVEVRWDCDLDAVLYRVRPHGPACHTGERTCFHSGERGTVPEPLGLGAEWEMLYAVALDRILRRPAGSYVAGLAAQGRARVAQKVGEEAVETVIASLGDSREQFVNELADLLFHVAVLCAATGLDPAEVTAELRRRRR